MKRPRVFISDSFADLEEHRAALLQLIRRADLAVEAAEYAAASSEDVIGSSLRRLREADGYICILGPRYGFVPDSQEENPEGLSLTEFEFREAQRSSIPTLVYMMSAKHLVRESEIESNPKNQKKLEAFRERVNLSSFAQILSTFDSLHDFASKVAADIDTLLRIIANTSSSPPKDSQTTAPLEQTSAPKQHPSIPRPPEFYAKEPYVSTGTFVGRRAQLELLSDWALAADPHPVMLIEGLGGSGKSMLIEYWATRMAAITRSDWAGLYSYSFYSPESSMEDFCRHALAYITANPVSEFLAVSLDELAPALFGHLQRGPWLFILDGLERLLVAYNRTAQEGVTEPMDSVLFRDPRTTHRIEDDDLLRRLTAAAPSKILIASRLTPLSLLDAQDAPVRGVRRETLSGLRPADAEALLRSCGVTGDSRAIQTYLIKHFECHALATLMLGGLIRSHIATRGIFDDWLADGQGGAGLHLENLDLVQRRRHILQQAYSALPATLRQLLLTISLHAKPVYKAALSLALPEITPSHLSSALHSLSRQGWISADNEFDRYHLHPTVRSIVLGTLSAEERAAEEQFPLPPPPQDLIDSCARAECVAFIGSGLAARAGLPTWYELVEALLQEAVVAGVMTRRTAERQLIALRSGEINAVADNVAGAFGDRNQYLLDYYRRRFSVTGPLPRSYELLRSIPFAAILTSNLDNILDRVLEGEEWGLSLTPRDSERLLELLATRKQRFLLKLYGDLGRPETVIIAPAGYQDLTRNNASFARFMEGLFFSRTLLFLGTSIDGLTDYLRALSFSAGVPRRHYALVAVAGVGWQAKSELLRRRYNVHVLPFRAGGAFTEVDTFLDQLVLATQGHTVPKEAGYLPGPRLWKVILENIGPFPRLELDTESNWKILLGDNGVGKSTILKAIAVAIVGSEARHWAAHLLRMEHDVGRITLTTRKNPAGYITEIRRVDAGADVNSHAARPLEAESWVAIGFPPLRSATWSSSQGPQGVSVKRPSSGDLMPLIAGSPDSRMDDLKQWLVNNDALSRMEDAPAADRHRAKAVLEKFVTIVSELTDQAVDAQVRVTTDFRVFVRTPDGIVPIESLSQGMTSLLSWVGILLQRLYEVHYGMDVKDPTEEYALVLMDEIDAHMHPVWQRTLVAKLQKLFPNIQVIASTHSPLVVAGLPVVQIARFTRDKTGQVVTPRIDQDMSIGRTDQILTGDLFGLSTTLALDDETAALMAEYRTLLAVQKRNAAEDKRFLQLHAELIDRIPPTPESKLERRAHDLALAVLEADFRPESLSLLKSSLLEKVKAVSESMGWDTP